MSARWASADGRTVVEVIDLAVVSPHSGTGRYDHTPGAPGAWVRVTRADPDGPHYAGRVRGHWLPGTRRVDLPRLAAGLNALGVDLAGLHQLEER